MLESSDEVVALHHLPRPNDNGRSECLVDIGKNIGDQYRWVLDLPSAQAMARYRVGRGPKPVKVACIECAARKQRRWERERYQKGDRLIMGSL